MKRQIKSPHKINWKMYSLILAISVLTMIIAVVLYEKNQNTIFDVTKNLAFGCVASTLVAFLIEIENVKEKNEKAFSVPGNYIVTNAYKGKMKKYPPDVVVRFNFRWVFLCT